MLEVDDTQVLLFFLNFYVQYVELVQMYSTWQFATTLIKSVGNVVYGEL